MTKEVCWGVTNGWHWPKGERGFQRHPWVSVFGVHPLPCCFGNCPVPPCPLPHLSRDTLGVLRSDRGEVPLILNSELGKLRRPEIKGVAQGHTGSKWLRQDRRRDLWAKTVLFSSYFSLVSVPPMQRKPGIPPCSSSSALPSVLSCLAHSEVALGGFFREGLPLSWHRP